MAQTPEFQHLALSRVKDVVVVEIVSKDLQGPAAARELGAELMVVAGQDWARQAIVDLHRVGYLSSTGFAVLVKLVKEFNAKGGQVKICNLNPALRLGAEIIGLDKFVEIHDSEAAALAAFKNT